MIEKHYNAKEVMGMLHVGRTTLWRMTNRSELTPIWIGGQRLFAESDIKNFIERRKGSHEKVFEEKYV
ncbi:putative DNA-binding transcriptional regulator AlpA [Clostridiales Family XIII bacterium PM5-7]